MQRAVWMCLLGSLAVAGCAMKTKSKCPPAFTPDDRECAAEYCSDHPDEAVCRALGDGGSATTTDPVLQRCASSASCTTPTMARCEEGACVPCREPADCAHFADAPACDPRGVCVACTPGDAALCAKQGKLCDASEPRCVDCNVNADCQAPTRPICDADACRGCRADADCAAAGKVCREATGECVDCEPNADDPAREGCANGRACHPETFTCTGQPVRSLADCGKSADPTVGMARCASDSECVAGRRCVETEFPRGTPYGRYCMQQATGISCPPGTTIKRTATSALGVTDSFCFPNELYVTCEGFLSFRSACAQDSDCGAADRNDGICREGRCTYQCFTDSECDLRCFDFQGVNSCVP